MAAALSVCDPSGGIYHPPTIIVVEDEDDLRSLVVEILTDSGYRVLSAGNGSDALRMMADEPVDLLFTDIVMPGLDGFDLARGARSLKPGLKVLYTTGYQHLRKDRFGVELQGKLLPKPYRPAQLLAEIKRALDRA